MTRTSAALRSTAFAAALVLITPPFALLAILVWPLPPVTRYRIVTVWSRLVVLLARLVCGIRYVVHWPQRPEGAAPCIVLSRHESAWETIAFQCILPPHVLVVKRELQWIPFFGWGLASLSPIAIRRAAGSRALRQVLEQGRARLARGFWIVVFPEGTRMAPDARRPYQAGGAWLASRTGTDVLPVAHNAGDLWPRNAFVKYPGTITVSIGPPIPARGRSAEDVNRDAQAWIEAEMARIGRAERR